VEVAVVSCVEKLVTCQGTVLLNPGVVGEGVVERVVAAATNVGRKAIWQEIVPLLVVEAVVEPRVALTVEKMDICHEIARNQEVKAEVSLVTTAVGMVICRRIALIREQVVVVEAADLVEIGEVMLYVTIIWC
jgi:predicted MarR family transcription regulator